MGKIYKNIVMEDVLDIIRKRGFYFIRTKVLYPDFVGPKYIIVTDDLDVTAKNPKTMFVADLGQGTGSEQANERPVVVVQNNKGNSYADTTIIAPITSRMVLAYNNKNKQRLSLRALHGGKFVVNDPNDFGD